MTRRHPKSTLTDTPFPYTTLYRSPDARDIRHVGGVSRPDASRRGRSPDLRPVRDGSGHAAVGTDDLPGDVAGRVRAQEPHHRGDLVGRAGAAGGHDLLHHIRRERSEEHKSELQSLMSTTYAVFCLKKQINQNNKNT